MKLKKEYIIIFSLIISICFFFMVPGKLLIANLNNTTDANVWEYIANNLGNGKIIYKDLFDHKGPILYFLYFIFKDYMLLSELLIFLINEILVYKISRLILNSESNIKNIVITAICMLAWCCTLNDFPNTESYSIPFILVSLYYFIKNIIVKFQVTSFWKIGICLAIVALLRINIITLWVIIYAYFFIILLSKKDYKNILKVILYTILGMSICFIPVFIWLISNGAFKSFIDCYILYNFIYISNPDEYSIWNTINYFLVMTMYIHPIILISNIVLLFPKNTTEVERKLLIFNIVYYLFTILIVILPRRMYLHYSMIVVPCMVIVLSILLKKRSIIIFIAKIYILLILFSYVCLSTNYYIDSVKEYNKEIDIIANWLNYNTKEDDNILVLGNEAVIYNRSNRTYKGRFFYQTPIIYFSEEIANQIIDEIKSLKPDYIILNRYEKNYNTSIDAQISEILEKEYIKQDFTYIRRKNE